MEESDGSAWVEFRCLLVLRTHLINHIGTNKKLMLSCFINKIQGLSYLSYPTEVSVRYAPLKTQGHASERMLHRYCIRWETTKMERKKIGDTIKFF